ncbi:hypothetical protein [Serratia ficaria]|uniref:hypothetical protein n=1 Tax=Serratia ficaria TaxID=61651 RepID=UPI00077C789D|nr:hypothetical protein [Serratia ficaria]CAI2504372.1 Uncharacterised protein [Serratia ficaria]
MNKNRKFKTAQEVADAIASGKQNLRRLINKLSPTSATSAEYKDLIRLGIALYRVQESARKFEALNNSEGE